MTAMHRLCLLLGVTALAAGCATKQPLYNWGPLDDQVYGYFKNEAPEAQIAILEKHAEVTRAQGKKLPPGYSAHLGLLYEKVGRGEDFIVALEQEKTSFPESSLYIDSLLKNANRVTLDAKK